MYFATNQKLSINKVENMGETLVLSDRSVWKVGMFRISLYVVVFYFTLIFNKIDPITAPFQ